LETPIFGGMLDSLLEVKPVLDEVMGVLDVVGF